MKSKDRMIRAIRSRKDLEPTHISLRKFLASGNMEHYLELCSDRIAENEMIDGEETAINFCDFPDILFTSDGLFDCRHILENYLSVDVLMDAWQLLLDEERTNREVNSLAAAFRKMKLPELWKCYKNMDLRKDAGEGQIVKEWIVWELWSRSLFSGIWRKAKEALTQVYVNVKYKGLFDIMRTAAEKYN